MSVSDAQLREALRPEGTLDVLGPEFDALGKRYSGKVRENFSRDGQRLIIVTDRVSAFDVVLGTIPFKGQILNQLAAFWFEETAAEFDNHVIDIPDQQATRAIECEPIALEMVVRAYLTGVSQTSIWRAYEAGARTFCGHELAEGMRKHQRLPKAIVTPSTKAEQGDHDRSVSKQELFEMGVVEPELFNQLEAQALKLFARGQAMAAERGLILVDTKYELGRTPEGKIVCIDEIHTPDSSRYWYSQAYDEAMAAGDDPKSLDKEFVRRWLVAQGWEGEGKPPALSDEVRMEAARRYIETYERLTGREFVPDMRPPIERLRAHLNLPS